MPSTARIGAAQLQTGQFQGQTVRAVGKLVNIDGNFVHLQLAGEGPVAIVDLNSSALFTHEAVNKDYFEVIGALQAENVISPMATVHLGEKFDMDLYTEMMGLTYQFDEVF
eukprot:CAMPEP_0183346280 /NCGR_PEP_ID=MMETSP0164_2-20130417/11446_1 /TAXON_ID=221442 /ORGANISM="Coccolithus pelagicus ssp braarudi, Strain PLY182g" /LENGTH=110 /DNA_ID=CAMNT_0025517531 /DNA_START=63 /DNA_END=395 /DNA_ORIENTATION=+